MVPFKSCYNLKIMLPLAIETWTGNCLWAKEREGREEIKVRVEARERGRRGGEREGEKERVR